MENSENSAAGAGKGTYLPEGWNQKKAKKRKPGGLFLFIVAVLVIVFCAAVIYLIFGSGSGAYGTVADDDGSFSIRGKYVAKLYITDEITTGFSYDSETQYSHEWMKNVLKELAADENNKGVILYVDTPGGSAYASAEMYNAIKKYKKKTKRPVYAYYASEAASGGYYITCGADKIIANQECWTGSIGVTLGTMYDVSGLLKKYGVKTTIIHSGKNKAMGSATEPLTKEQRQILQSLVDESYDSFVNVVAEGRGMSRAEVLKLADGRVYTAKQALRNGLIDGIAEEEEATRTFLKDAKLTGTAVRSIVHDTRDSSLLGSLGELLGKSSSKSEVSEVKELMELNGKVQLQYISALRK